VCAKPIFMNPRSYVFFVVESICRIWVEPPSAWKNQAAIGILLPDFV